MNNQGLIEQVPQVGMFVYFSYLMDREAVDCRGETVGWLYDIIVQTDQVYPRSSSLIIRKGFINHRYALLSWDQLAEITLQEIKLRTEKSSVSFVERHEYKDEFSLRKDVLDQQVVDTYNQKVIRVNDIHFLTVDSSLAVMHVDISIRGLIRRLGWEHVVDFIVRLFNRKAAYLHTEHLISWKYIQPLSINPVSMSLKVNVPQNQFRNIPAPDLGEIFKDLNTQDQIALFKSLDLNTRAKIFRNIDFKTQRFLIDQLGVAEVAAILNVIPPDEATDFLEQLSREMMQKFLSIMESKQAKKLSELLGYSSDSAGGLMTIDFLAFKKGTKVADAIQQIKVKQFKGETVQFVYIVDEENRLVASMNFQRLIAANPDDPVEQAAFSKTYFVKLDSSVKEVAYLMEKYKYNAVPVVDEQSVLKGIVTVDDILSQVIAIAWRRLKKIKATPRQ
jgi:CBS domain-containing protein